MKKLLLLLFAVLVMASSAIAQRTVNGTVTDETGTPLIGASVVVKENPAIGTITDLDGNFALTLPAGTTALVVSYVGYTTRDIAVTDAMSYSIVLQEGRLLDEVIVTTFGTTTRERFTGSAVSINSEQIAGRAISNVTQVLVGSSAGVQSIFGSGQPGEAPTIRIRGFGSISSSNAPLYVVDGVPFTANTANLNPNDIENVTILKDAASTALYGSRAANGVVMITTKKGRKGAPRINLKYTRGQSSRGVPEYDRIGPADYYPIMWESYRNSLAYRASNPLSLEDASINASANIVGLLGYNIYNVPSNELVGVDGKLNPNATLLYGADEMDWVQPLMRAGGRDDVNFNVSGGTDDSDYYFSLGYVNDLGYLIRTSMERYTGRLALNSQLKSWLKVGGNLSYTYSLNENNDADGNASFVNPFMFSRGMGPIYPVHAFDPENPGQFLLDDNGSRIYDFGNLSALGLPNRPQYGGRHVIAETEWNVNLFKRNVFIGRTYADFSFLNDFKFSLTAGIDYTNRFDNDFQNPRVGDGSPAGRAYARYYNGTGINLGQLLSYRKNFGMHFVDLLVGHESFGISENELSGRRSVLISEGNIDLVNFTTTTSLNSVSNARRIEGYFSRLNYDYADKYFLSLSLRRDGSSRFSKENRWGTFYSAGAAWRLDQEQFVRDIPWINSLKFRASYGQTGNESINTWYAWQDLYLLGPGVNNASEAGLIQDRSPGNPELKWETNSAFDVAIEFGLFGRRLFGSIGYYNKESSNLLFQVPLPFSTGLTDQWRNIGSMYNRGIETELSFVPVRTRDFEWVISGNITTLENKITKMPRKDPGSEDPQEIISGTKKRAEGYSIQEYWLREWMGVNPLTGAAEYRANEFIEANSRITENGDTVTTNINNARYHWAGRAIPDFYGGIGNSISYKGLSLSFLVVYQIGGKIYDSVYGGLMGAGGYGSAKHPDILNRWQQEGDITNVPRMDAGQTANFDGASDRWLIDATALSLRNVVLSYSVPQSWLNRYKIGNVQFLLSGENLALWSKRRGMNAFDAFTGVTSNSFGYARVFTGGINLTF